MMIPTRLPGRGLWLFLVLPLMALMALVLLRVLTDQEVAKDWLARHRLLRPC